MAETGSRQTKPVIVWFRQDLRLHDNPALKAAIETGLELIPVYIFDAQDSSWAPGAASRWWLHHSLHALQNALRELGSDLLILGGNSQQALKLLCQKTSASHVFWNRCYEPEAIERDRLIKRKLCEYGLEVNSFNGSLLFEPWLGTKKDGSPYRIFTPYWKALQKRGISLFNFTPPKKLPSIEAVHLNQSLDIDSIDLLARGGWDNGLQNHWTPGETGAHQNLQRFSDSALLDYPQDRDYPAFEGTACLSPHLHFGEISPWQIWQAIQDWSDNCAQAGRIKASEVFLRQLGWREFAFHLLYFFPHTATQPLDPRFKKFPWQKNYQKQLQLWQKGLTGIPIVDAGMRQLWHCGWMHNRVRMIAASFLSKNLLIPWQAGAKWFWDTLVDADLANNTLGWQWVAGCGADAAPFFRIFNPVRQGERFDPTGKYVRHWVPELNNLSDKWIHQPWLAPKDVLAQASVELGKSYPHPITDLPSSRRRALTIWDTLKRRPN